MTRPSTDSDRLRSSLDLASLTRTDAIREIRRLERKLETTRRQTDSSPTPPLLAEVSHELRTPITGIVKLAEILSEKATGGQERKFARLIKKSGKQLEQTVNAVLSLAKLDAHPNALDCRPLNVPEEVEPVSSTFRPRAEAKGLNYTFTVEDADGPLYASLNPGALSSIIQNLLSNAMKYTETGSVDVTVRSVLQSGLPVIEIEVADTGVGMSESFSTELFDRFKQESTASDDVSNGVGIGLTLVERFSERMGGTVDVETEKGEGSQFFVRFPRVSERSTPAHRSPDDSSPSLDSAKEILFIEANLDIRRDICGMIEDRWGITSAATFTEGLRFVTERRDDSRCPFDLVLLGVEHGERISDEHFLHSLEKRTNGHDVPVIALARGDWPLPGALLTLDGYIKKPFTSWKLVTEMARYLHS